MAKKTSNSKKRKVEQPMKNDQLIQLDNIPDKKDICARKELLELPTQHISALRKSKKLDLGECAVYKRNSLELHLGSNHIIGQTGGRIQSLKSTKSRASSQSTVLKSGKPDWSGITFHPKVSAAPAPVTFRKKRREEGGAHYVFGRDDRQIYYPSGYPYRNPINLTKKHYL